jgi:hypothetical protein
VLKFATKTDGVAQLIIAEEIHNMAAAYMARPEVREANRGLFNLGHTFLPAMTRLSTPEFVFQVQRDALANMLAGTNSKSEQQLMYNQPKLGRLLVAPEGGSRTSPLNIILQDLQTTTQPWKVRDSVKPALWQKQITLKCRQIPDVPAKTPGMNVTHLGTHPAPYQELSIMAQLMTCAALCPAKHAVLPPQRPVRHSPTVPAGRHVQP